MSARRGESAQARLSRRRFVTLMAAGSAGALATGPVPGTGAKEAVAQAPAQAEAQAVAPTAAEKEFERQKKGTLATLKTIRDYPLPPGGDLAVVFRPLRATRKTR